MHRLTKLITRFARDERGVFAVIYGLIAIVLVAVAGAVVDYVAFEQARTRAQTALDAAALALQPEILKKTVDTAGIRTKAEALLLERLGDEFGVAATLGAVNIDVPNGQLTLDANLRIPTIFVALVGVPELRAYVQSQATRKMLELEVIMVLDNSGSMSGSPMTNLKTAACNAVNILFFDRDGLGCNLPSGVAANAKLSMGVVPFTSMVNIGTRYANEPWLDWTGKSAVSRINFDDDDNASTYFAGPVNRRDLFANTNTTWAGCVEARISPFDTTDDPPDTDERLFVPLFTVDAADGLNRSYVNDTTGGKCTPKTCTVETRCSIKSKSSNSCLSSPPATTSYTLAVNGGKELVPTSCTSGGTAGTATTTYPNNTTKVVTTVWTLPMTWRERQSRLCKYSGSFSNSSTNYSCPAADVQPLTQTPKSVLDSINAMVASGNTNIQQGAVWGMHALTSGAPMEEGKPTDPGRVSKIMILMTDGDNQPQMASDANGSAYFSWGFMNDGRLGPVTSQTTLRQEMDKRTKDACDYAKDHRGIEIYSIGLNVSNSNKALLTGCASSSSHAYFPKTPTELNGVFRDIAAKLASLRLSL